MFYLGKDKSDAVKQLFQCLLVQVERRLQFDEFLLGKGVALVRHLHSLGHSGHQKWEFAAVHRVQHFDALGVQSANQNTSLQWN